MKIKTASSWYRDKYPQSWEFGIDGPRVSKQRRRLIKSCEGLIDPWHQLVHSRVKLSDTQQCLLQLQLHTHTISHVHCGFWLSSMPYIAHLSLVFDCFQHIRDKTFPRHILRQECSLHDTAVEQIMGNATATRDRNTTALLHGITENRTTVRWKVYLQKRKSYNI